MVAIFLVPGAFHAERIAAQRVELARLPTASDPEPDAGAGLLSLPVDISIGALSFPDIALGSAVTGGQVASVAANGRAMAQGAPLTVAADLNVKRTDGTAGEVLASIDFAPAQNKLDIDLKASEPTRRHIGEFAQAAWTAGVDIIVSGSGPMADWRGSGSFAVEATDHQRLGGRTSGDGRRTGRRRKGDGDFARFLPERLRPLGPARRRSKSRARFPTTAVYG